MHIPNMFLNLLQYKLCIIPILNHCVLGFLICKPIVTVWCFLMVVLAHILFILFYSDICKL